MSPSLALILAQFETHKNLKALHGDTEKQLQKIKKQLEEETLARVDLENKNQSLKEDLQFKSQLYEKVRHRVHDNHKSMLVV